MTQQIIILTRITQIVLNIILIVVSSVYTGKITITSITIACPCNIQYQTQTPPHDDYLCQQVDIIGQMETVLHPGQKLATNDVQDSDRSPLPRCQLVTLKA